MMSDGIISSGHGRALLAVKGEKERVRIAKLIEKNGLSVREVEKMSSDAGKPPAKKGRPAERNADVLQVEAELKEHLGTKVNLKLGAKKGKIEIEYYSRDELERLIDLLRSL
jgi:ParB family chromosome partitioning protein